MNGRFWEALDELSPRRPLEKDLEDLGRPLEYLWKVMGGSWEGRWQLLQGHGQSRFWGTLEALGRPLEGRGRPWVAFEGLGRPWKAQGDLGRLRRSWETLGRPWKACASAVDGSLEGIEALEGLLRLDVMLRHLAEHCRLVPHWLGSGQIWTTYVGTELGQPCTDFDQRRGPNVSNFLTFGFPEISTF